MKTIINKINLYYEKYGNKEKNIIILPGWGETRKTFKDLINQLKEHYTIYIIDYPGFGNTNFPNKDLTIYDYANIIKIFIEKNNIKEPNIIAHSFGARITIILEALLKVKINKIIIINGAGIKSKKTIKQSIYKALKKLTNILPKKLKEKAQEKLLKIFSSEDYKALPQNMKKTFSNIVKEDLTYLLKDINTETLLIWGEKDTSTPLKDGIKMNKLIKNSGLIIIKNETHFLYINMSHYITKIILEFIK